jgi:hypothetical protein
MAGTIPDYAFYIVDGLIMINASLELTRSE